MLEIQRIREQPDLVKKGLLIRNYSEEKMSIVDDAITVDQKRREIQTLLDHKLSFVNSRSKDIGQLFREGKQEESNALRSEVSQIKEEIKKLETQLKEAKGSLEEILLAIPNVPNQSVPPGKGETEN